MHRRKGVTVRYTSRMRRRFRRYWTAFLRDLIVIGMLGDHGGVKMAWTPGPGAGMQGGAQRMCWLLAGEKTSAARRARRRPQIRGGCAEKAASMQNKWQGES